jgi:MFS family permease
MPHTSLTATAMGEVRPAIRSAVCYFFLNGFLFGVWASRIPTIRDKLSLGEQQLGLLLLCMGVGAVMAMALSGRWCDTFGQYFVAKRAAWLMAANIPLLALAPSPLTLGIVMFLYGAFGGALDMAMNGFATEVEAACEKSIMSRMHGTWSIGAGTGAATGILASSAGAGLVLHFLLATVAMMAVLFFVDRANWTKSDGGILPPAKIIVLPGGRLAMIGVVALVAFMAEGVVQDWGALYVVDRFDQTEAIGASGLVWFAVAMVTMRLSGDMIIDRFGPRNSVVFAACAGACGSFITVAAPVHWIVWIGYAVMGTGLSLLAPIAFAEAARQKAYSKGHAMAAVTMLGYGGMLIGPPLIGGVAELFSLRHGFGLIAVLSLSLLLVAKYFRAASQSGAG